MSRRAKRQAQDVRPDVFGPGRDALLQLRVIIREERARRIFIAGQIARHGQHEVIGGLLGGTFLLSRSPASAGLVYQPSQGGRCATRLSGQPVPVPRQQCHLARDDSQFWSPPAPWFEPLVLRRFSRLIRTGAVAPSMRLRRLGQSLDDVGLGPAQVQIDDAAGRIVENEDRVR